MKNELKDKVLYYLDENLNVCFGRVKSVTVQIVIKGWSPEPQPEDKFINVNIEDAYDKPDALAVEVSKNIYKQIEEFKNPAKNY